MKSSLFAKMLNTFWTTIAFFVLAFAFARHYLPAKYALLLSALIAILLEIVLIKFRNKKLAKSGILSSELEHAQKVINALYISSKKAVDLFFLRAIQKTCPEATITNGFIETHNHIIFACFENKITTTKEILSKIEQINSKNKEIIAFGIEFEPEIASMKIKTFSGAKTYAFLKEQKTFPKVENVVLKKKKFFSGILNKKHTIKYFILAIIFSISSFFVPQTKLYIICSAIVSILAIFCIFSKKEFEESFKIN